jgi:hypothetical protein
VNRLSLRRTGICSLLAFSCAAAVLTGCGGTEGGSSPDGSQPAKTSTAPAAASNSPEPTAQAAPFRFPLTGLPTQTKVISRPYVVMVENSPQSRPQTGLDQADIVFEILAEGEITRFVSVYQSHEAKAIGPVRSIRPYFVEIGAMLDAVIVHAGWSQDAMNILSSRKLAHLDQVYGDHAYYWRASDRKAPHNLYTSVELMAKGATDRKFRKEWNAPQLAFAKEEALSPLSGPEALHIEIPYIRGYVVSYEYDKAAGMYKRSMDGSPHLDKETGEQLRTRNLLVLEARHSVLDKEGRRSVDVFGPGKGTLLQQGRSQAITWEQKNSMLRVFADGKEMPLLPGNTWIQVVPEGSATVIGQATAGTPGS